MNERAKPWRLNGGAGKYLGLAQYAVANADENGDDARGVQQKIAHRNLDLLPYSTVWIYGGALALVNTVVYGGCRRVNGTMADQLSAQDWVDLGLKTLARSGFAALKAEPLAKAM